nr:hypothetical protein [Deltaproteobacteria bacterium]
MTAPPRGDDERSALLSSTAEQMAQVYARGIPAVLRPAGPLFEMEEVFTWIAAAHPPRTERSSLQKIQALLGRASGQPSPEREVDPGRPAELYRDGGLLLDATPYLPLPDETFEPWVSRVRDALGTGFGLQAPGVECASFEASHRLQTLL